MFNQSREKLEATEMCDRPLGEEPLEDSLDVRGSRPFDAADDRVLEASRTGRRSYPRLSVLYVINSLGAGGSERSLAEMLPGLVGLGVRPIVTCLRQRNTGVQDEVRANGIEVRVLRGGAFVEHVRELRDIVRSKHIDLVHTSIFESDLAGRLAAAGTGVPVLTTLVNTTYEPVRRADPRIVPWKLEGIRVIDGWTARHLTSHFHAVGRAVKVSASKALRIPLDQITVIERGRDPIRLGTPSPMRRSVARKRLGIQNEHVLVNLGRHEFQKGQEHLLEAIRLLRSDGRGTLLLIAGRSGASTRDLLRLQAQRGLQGTVRFLGHRDDVPELLASADVFVLPSLYEGMSGALIEAMALGLPIVASDIDAVREEVEEGGNALLVPPASPHELAKAIGALLHDRKRARSFGLRSREIFEERFTLDRSIGRMRRLYKDIVERTGR
jgi:glycosyltransferase involved in cell wall biosynthesis